MSLQMNSNIEKLKSDSSHLLLLPSFNGGNLHPKAVVPLETETYYLPAAENNALHTNKVRTLKNLFVLCFGMLLVFTAYEALMNLQSTINVVQNVGTYAMAVVYAAFGASCLVLPSIAINKLGCKVTIVLGLFGYSPYIAANFYPRWWTLLPSAVLCGLSAGPLWAARSTYVNELSFQFASQTGDSATVVTAFFFGICCMSYQGAQVLGNIISYHVLKPRNETYTNHEIQGVCGAHFCNRATNYNSSLTNLNSNLEPPTEEQRFTLVAIFLICSIVSAFVVWLFLDRVNPEHVKKEMVKETKPVKLIFAACNQLKKSKQLLLLPLTFHLGLSDGFLFSDFTKAFIGCSWKIYHVGYVMMVYGIVSSLLSIIIPFFLKYFGRTAVFSLGGITNAIKYVFLLIWNPAPDNPVTYFLIVSAWGLADAVWWSQISALYGLIFKSTEEAAFSVFYFILSCGFLLAYVYEEVLCTYVKIYIIFGTLIVGFIGYLIVEYTTPATDVPNNDLTTCEKIPSQQEVEKLRCSQNGTPVTHTNLH